MEDASGYLDALKKYNHRWERESIKSTPPLVDDVIPPGFEIQGWGEGYLLSSKRAEVDGVSTYHFFAPSTSVPEIAVPFGTFFRFNSRAGLGAVITMDTKVLGCVNLTRKCSTIHSEYKTRPVKVEVSRISTSDSSWPPPFQSCEFQPRWEYFCSIFLTSRRIAIIAEVNAEVGKNIFVWDLDGKPYLVSLLICLLNVNESHGIIEGKRPM